MISRRLVTAGIGVGVAGGLMIRSGTAPAADGWPGVVGDACRRIEAKVGGRLGVAVMDTASGTRASHRGGERFPILSTFKALACGAVLKRVDDGKETLGRRILYSAGDLVPHSPTTKEHVADGMTLAELCTATMTLSDNTAGNLILQALEGPEGLTRFVRGLDDKITRLDRWEVALNEAATGDPRDTTTPDSMAENLRKLVVGDTLSASSRNQLTAWLVANKTGDARLRAGLPKTWRVGDRTGTGDNGATNDVAVAWPPGRGPIIICVYLTETRAALDDRNAAIAAIGWTVASALAA